VPAPALLCERRAPTSQTFVGHKRRATTTFNRDEREQKAIPKGVGTMSSKLMEYFNKQPRIGTISTARKDGKVDVAVMGSPHMTDEKTVILGSGSNRTLVNLQDNPHAVYMIMEPGQTLMDWKGVRVYLEMKDLATSGPVFDHYVKELAKVAGEATAAMIHALVSFEITEVRPIVDMGQGWEQSI
jgi:hypothetical protein